MSLFANSTSFCLSLGRPPLNDIIDCADNFFLECSIDELFVAAACLNAGSSFTVYQEILFPVAFLGSLCHNSLGPFSACGVTVTRERKKKAFFCCYRYDFSAIS